MMERILLSSLLKEQPPYPLLSSLVQRIEDYAVIVYPTETIYGIGGRGDSTAVQQKIIAAKTREPNNPMILVAGALKNFSSFNLHFAPAALALAQQFWPGNLTLVVPCNDDSGTLGIRVSGHPFIQLLYRKLSVPVFSTSANISGTEYQNNPDAIYETFKNCADIMIDAGILPASLSSTVVSVSKNNDIKILREGILPVRDVLGCIF
jgi:L-threonylcarbamoyladenylate synthase